MQIQYQALYNSITQNQQSPVTAYSTAFNEPGLIQKYLPNFYNTSLSNLQGYQQKLNTYAQANPDNPYIQFATGLPEGIANNLLYANTPNSSTAMRTLAASPFPTPLNTTPSYQASNSPFVSQSLLGGNAQLELPAGIQQANSLTQFQTPQMSLDQLLLQPQQNPMPSVNPLLDITKMNQPTMQLSSLLSSLNSPNKISTSELFNTILSELANPGKGLAQWAYNINPASPTTQ